VAKALYLSSQNTVDCYKLFCSVSKFFITNTTFFPSWNICSIIHLISITYLALVYNYNTIKCICFISLRQRASMSSCIYIKDDALHAKPRIRPLWWLEKWGHLFFHPKSHFQTYFDPKHTENTLETLLHQSVIFKNLINHHKTRKHQK
jgi:hypothetical protein